jgi:Ni,Fe-hydrogenase III component G
VIPGAILYERELQDMFGIVVEGLPDPRPLLLCDDWPAGEHPLRKDWKFERPEEKIPGGE